MRDVTLSVHDELEFLSATRASAPILAGIDNRDQIDEIRHRLTRAAELTKSIADGIRDGQQSLTTRHLSDLEGTYGRLTAMVAGWPRVD